MYAIVELGGRQWKVEPGARLDVNRLPAAVGSAHVVDRVLFAQHDDQRSFGRPYVADAKVVCEVLEHRLGPKEISYHFRRRENWRKTRGHRQPLTRLVVKEIVFGGVVVAPKEAAPKKASAAKPRASTSGSSAAKKPTVRPKKEA
ncbi:MAG: 50S ribosomal protein L21 [Candidatus Omnitrophota bacterium]|nr:50S ribosomal protein L21 [Candidatus Omnitrophota bacterium]